MATHNFITANGKVIKFSSGGKWYSPPSDQVCIDLDENATFLELVPVTKGLFPATTVKSTDTVNIDNSLYGSSISALYDTLIPLFPKRNTGSAGTGTSILTLTPVSTTQINAAWTAVNGAISYALERSLAANFSSIITIYTGTGLSFSDTGLTPGTQYYYRVKVTVSNSSTAQNATTNSILVTNNTFAFTLPFNLS